MLSQQLLGFALGKEEDERIPARDSVEWKSDNRFAFADHGSVAQFPPARHRLLRDAVPLELLECTRLNHQRLRILRRMQRFVDDPNGNAEPLQFNCGSQAGRARTDDERLGCIHANPV